MQTVISNTHLPDTEMNSLTLNDAKVELTQIAKQAKEAAWQLAKLTAKQKNDFLHGLADALISKQDDILSANALDMTFAHSVEVAEAMLDRLRLTPERIAQIAHEVRHVASLPDPVGVTLAGNLLDSGLRLEKRAVPLGVVAVIYEARPNVTIDVASLCFKTGNAAILRGGKETVHTNRILVEIIQATLLDFGLPTFSVQAILNPDRAYVSILLKLDQYIDMLIPRGGAGLHRLCKEHSTIPVITGGIGVCHIYLDNQYFPNQNLTSGNIDSKLSDAIDSALSIIDNAKIQRPSACNSLETLLVHTELAALFLPKLYHYMHQKSVVLRVCEQVEVILKEHCPILSGTDLPSGVQRVTQSDYEEESLGLILNVKLVDSIDDAIAHIRAYGTDHSDSILTQNMLTADYFIDSIDSAAVYVNASTRFTDGAQFGLGAEVAVSTQKLHARGPMGLEALTTYKWIGRGDNVIRK